jgi:hypothetical protein
MLKIGLESNLPSVPVQATMKPTKNTMRPYKNHLWFLCTVNLRSIKLKEIFTIVTPAVTQT